MSSLNTSSAPTRIAILANPQLAHGRNFIKGAMSFLSEQARGVSADLLTGEPPVTIEGLQRYSGVLSGMEEPLLRALPESMPVFRLDEFIDDGQPGELPLAHREIGRLAAQVLTDCGVVSYGYYDSLRSYNKLRDFRSGLRLAGFREGMEKYVSPLIKTHFDTLPTVCLVDLSDWLEALPKPAGIFTFNDLGALQVAEACRLRGISVPREVAIIGVDNDRLLCHLSQPFISSVDASIERLAYEAMRLLLERIDQPIQSEADACQSMPTVDLRESTGHSSSKHPVIQAALSLIGNDESMELSAKSVAQSLGQSLRNLELVFSEQLGCTVQQRLIQARIHRTKHLLRATEQSFEQICETLDQDVSNLRRSFTQSVGMPPSEYRALFRGAVVTSLPDVPSDVIPEISICFLNTLEGQATRDLLRGAEEYVRAHAGVRLSLNVEPWEKEQSEGSKRLGDLPHEAYDGFLVITAAEVPSDVIGNKPVIYLDHHREHSLSMSVHLDNREVGALAGQHLLEKGYINFAYCDYGATGARIGDRAIDLRQVDRYEGFCDVLTAAGVAKDSIRLGHYVGDGQVLSEWLCQLPRPTALLAFNDTLAITIIALCQQVGIRIPEDIGLIGVDNDASLGQRISPSLSSVDVCFKRMGHDALADLVAAVRVGKASEFEPKIFPPRMVVERASTANLATDHPSLNRAVQFMKHNLSSEIGNDEIAQASALSRRSLETHFKKSLRMTPRAYLERLRLYAAQDLLTLTDLSIEAIAVQSGFKRSSNLSRVFKERVGESPLEYRRSRADEL